MNKKVLICTPCYDAMMTMQYTLSLLKLITCLNQYKIGYSIDFKGNESLIPRARNDFLGDFIESDCSHLLFIDSDIEFEPQAVLDLLSFNKDVTCCVYPKKGYNWNKFMYSMQNEKQSKESLESRGLDFSYNLCSNIDSKTKKQEFIKVKHAATGFMMISRDIVEKLYKKHTELMIVTDTLSKRNKTICGLFCCMIKNKTYLSEDYSFCERVNDIGGEVWIHTNHNLNHIGKYAFKSDIKNRTNLSRYQYERKFY